MKPKNILFVCTGNTCRSPMAMGILRNHLQEKGVSDVLVDSAGLAAYGDAISNNALQALKEIGIDLSGHVSKSVSAELVQWADLIVVMTENHKNALLRAGVHPDSVTVLGGGISDPYGGSLQIYRETRDEIRTAVEALARERGLFGD